MGPRILLSMKLSQVAWCLVALCLAAPAHAAPMSLLGVDASVQATPSTSAAETTAAPSDPLTTEEAALVAERLLPPGYGALKALARTQGEAAAAAVYCRGLTGPFSPGYGEPKALLDGARGVHESPELVRMYGTLRRGDIVVIAYNNPDDYIAKVTGGPFTHAMICTEDGPPVGFIEAVGITGKQGEASANRVRRVMFHPGKNLTVRVLRPTEGMDATAAAEAVDRATAFAASQLGKPYNYSFTDTSKGASTPAFYCSELCYLAYVSLEGAHLTIELNKSPERDQLLEAVDALINALHPRDKRDLMGRFLMFMNRRPRPDAEQLVAFLVDSVMTDCQLTDGVAPTGPDRAKLIAVLDTVIKGRAFDRFVAAQKAHRDAAARGDFGTPVLGAVRRGLSEASIAGAWTEDMAGLTRKSGIEPGPAAAMTEVLVRAVLPHADVIAEYLFGPKDVRTRSASDVLDALDRVKRDLGHVPLLNRLTAWVPARAPLRIKTDFVSPSDLAWAHLPHTDYNVLPGHSIEPPPDSTARLVPSTKVN